MKRQGKYARIEAVEAHARQEGDSADIALLTFLNDRSWEVRESCVRSLIERRSRFALLAVRTSVTDPSWAVRDTAVEALEEVGNLLDLPRLVHALTDEHWVVRASAAGSLARFRGSTARRALKKALDDPEPDVRRYAAFSLARQQEPSTVPVLEDRLRQEHDERARVGLLGGLYGLGQRAYLSELLDLLDSPAPSVRCQVLSAFEVFRFPDDRDYIGGRIRERLPREEHAEVRHQMAIFLSS